MLRVFLLYYCALHAIFSSLNGEDKCFLARPYVEIAAGTDIGVNQSYSTLGVITTFPTNITNSVSRLWLYTDASWYHLIKGSNGATVEGGFVWGNDYTAFGGYTGYDCRRWHHNSFSQIVGGIQMMRGCWQVFVNLYCPLQDEVVFCSTKFRYSGGFRATLRDFDATYRMASINITRTFNTCIPCVSGVIGLEPYYMRSGSQHICDKIEQSWGGKLRFLLNISDIFKVEANVSHDKIFNTRAQVVLGIDLLQAFNCSYDPVCPLYHAFKRQTLVPIKHRDSWQYNWSEYSQ